MEEVSVVAQRTVKLANMQLHGTQCIDSAMCFTECCDQLNVLNVYVQVLRKPTDIVICVTVVLVEGLRVYCG
jgi:hypothetical protein